MSWNRRKGDQRRRFQEEKRIRETESRRRENSGNEKKKILKRIDHRADTDDDNFDFLKTFENV